MVWTLRPVTACPPISVHILGGHIHRYLLGWKSLVSGWRGLLEKSRMARGLAAGDRIRSIGMVAHLRINESSPPSLFQGTESELIRVWSRPHRLDRNDVWADAVSNGLVYERGVANEGRSVQETGCRNGAGQRNSSYRWQSFRLQQGNGDSVLTWLYVRGSNAQLGDAVLRTLANGLARYTAHCTQRSIPRRSGCDSYSQHRP